MSPAPQPRRMRADAQQSTARILEAANTVLTADPGASLERIAEEAGLARATVHRRFSSRQALLDALAQQLTDRYLLGLKQARVKTAPPVIALHRLTEIALKLKIGHPFANRLLPPPDSPGAPASNPEILEGLDTLFTRLHEAGEITASDPAWCSRLYLAILMEIADLPADSPALGLRNDDLADEIGTRTDLLIRTLLGALGGAPPR
jgi:AcrR family transcriptional regulator